MNTHIHKETLNFLVELKGNNKRDWFNSNKDLYHTAHQNLCDFVSVLIEKIAQFDNSVDGLDPKKCIFRIYKDIRFSKDKSPYKTHFGAIISENGLSGSSGYYLHIEPDASMLGGGAYHPEPDLLRQIRQKISQNPDAYTKIIKNSHFKKNFGEISGERLKNVPKGFDKNNPMSNYLKLKDFVMIHKIDNEKLLSEDFADYCATIFKSMVSFNSFLHSS